MHSTYVTYHIINVIAEQKRGNDAPMSCAITYPPRITSYSIEFNINMNIKTHVFQGVHNLLGSKEYRSFLMRWQ